jgi:hypothetical protein
MSTSEFNLYSGLRPRIEVKMEEKMEEKMEDRGVGKLCIPRIENTIQKEFIFKKLCALNIGYIQKLTEIPLKSNPNFKRILIKIKWNTSQKTLDLKNKLMSGQTIKFVYQMPWFWKICVVS